MNFKIFIAVGIIIAAIVIFAFIANENPKMDLTESTIIEENKTSNITDITEKKTVDELLDEINKTRQDNEYIPKPREWQTSGPFEIDRKEYILGEKVFMRINQLKPSDKGQITLLRPLNATHYDVYQTVPFDGNNPNTFNVYFDPDLSKSKSICTKKDLIGRWAIVFRGTDYENLYFNVIDQILPGEEERYKPAC